MLEQVPAWHSDASECDRTAHQLLACTCWQQQEDMLPACQLHQQNVATSLLLCFLLLRMNTLSCMGSCTGRQGAPGKLSRHLILHA